MAAEQAQSKALGPADSAAPSTNLLDSVRDLDGRLRQTQQEVEDLKKSDRSWLKKVGMVLGVLGGLIATPKLIKDNIVDIVARADTTVDWGRPLNVRYDQHDGVLRLDFPVLANNEGTKTDIVETISATLRGTEASDVNIQVSDSDLEINEGDRSIHLPFAIEAQKPKPLVLAFSLASPLSERALGFEGKRVLGVDFKTRAMKRISYQYCFNLDKKQADEILAAKELHVRFSNCD